MTAKAGADPARDSVGTRGGEKRLLNRWHLVALASLGACGDSRGSPPIGDAAVDAADSIDAPGAQIDAGVARCTESGFPSVPAP
ncbi:MAG TPA: hypothetical protein VGD80_27630, partial [Kofleriaceae bacterium]